jgi:hypothetical protein
MHEQSFSFLCGSLFTSELKIPEDGGDIPVRRRLTLHGTYGVVSLDTIFFKPQTFLIITNLTALNTVP